jgi:hypothetical protein
MDAINDPTNTADSEQPRSWRDALKVHPAADVFDPLRPDELKELADDIDKHGLREPVTLYDDPKIGLCLLDGRNRADALELIGKGIGDDDDECLTELVGEDDPNFDPYAYVVSKNIKRRHLSAEDRQRLLIALIARTPEKSNRQLGEDIGVDHKTIGLARAKGEQLGSIPQLEMTTGKDGKERPAHRFRSRAGLSGVSALVHRPPDDPGPEPVEQQGLDTDTATDDTQYDPIVEATIEEMQADPATYWDELTDDAFTRLIGAYNKARLARYGEVGALPVHAVTANALGELIAAATELKTFYETHLLPPGRKVA